MEILNSLLADDNLINLLNPLLCEDIPCIIDRIINFMISIATAVFPIIVLVGAFHFITSGGNPERVRRAKNIITYTIIGFFNNFIIKGNGRHHSGCFLVLG